jgi:hypothetical protein
MDIEEDGLSGQDPCKPIWFAVAFGRNRTVVKLLLERGARPAGLFAAAWWDDTALLEHPRASRRRSRRGRGRWNAVRRCMAVAPPEGGKISGAPRGEGFTPGARASCKRDKRFLRALER